MYIIGGNNLLLLHLLFVVTNKKAFQEMSLFSNCPLKNYA